MSGATPGRPEPEAAAAPEGNKPGAKPGRRPGASSPKRIEAQMRQRQVWELRLAGRTFPQIAEDLGFAGPSGAYKAYRTALKRNVDEPIESMILTAERRHEALLFAVWNRALGGDIKAINSALAILRQLADLKGLNAPKEIDLRVEAKEIAERYGLNEDDVLAEAQEWIKRNGVK